LLDTNFFYPIVRERVICGEVFEFEAHQESGEQQER